MKITRHNASYVVVEPDMKGWAGWEKTPDKWRTQCEDIVFSINRHIDGVASVYVEDDTDEVCEHCGSHWTEGDALANGGCCEKDAIVMEEIGQ